MTRTRIISDMIADGTVLTVDLSDASVTSPKISFPVRAPNGAAAAPSYSFINATGAGLRWDAGASWFNIENPTGRLVLSAKLDPVLVSNGYDFDGTNWRSYDTAQASATATMSGSGGFAWYIAPATTGNLAWVNRMALDASGNLTIGGSFEPTVNITLKNGAALIARTPDGAAHTLLLMNNEVLFYNYAATQYRWVNQANTVELMKLTNAGALSTSSLITGATSVSSLSVSSTLTVSNHTMISQATGGIGTTGSSEGQLELQNAGSGAAKIAFHRTGVYAAYLGLDTDNIWAVGGWSMGGSRYRIILGDGFSNGGALTVGGRITGNADAVFTSVYANTYYMGMSGSYYWTLSNSNYARSAAMHIMSDGVFAFNANTAINLSSDNSNIASSHRFLAPNFSVGNGGSYQMVDTNVRIARPAGTNIMYIYAYDAQWAFIRTPDSTNVGYVDNGGFHSISKLKHKTNIVPIRDGLELVLDQRVTPISYAVKGYDTPDTPSLGFSAEDMSEVVPNAVGYDEEGPASINYGSLVAVLWDAVRTLNTRIEELEKAA